MHSIAEPMWHLTRKTTPWQCTSREQNAFDQLKSVISEALGAVSGCERFWLYLVGQRFKLVTDNRAVQLIFSNSAMKPPARIERWALRLTQFDYEIVHRPSGANVADYFSRHPRKGISSVATLEESQVERYVNLVVSCSMPRAISKDELIEATKGDRELQELIVWVRCDR